MNCYLCGGSNGLVIYELAPSFKILPQHKNMGHCIQTLNKKIVRMEEKLNEISDFDPLTMEPL